MTTLHRSSARWFAGVALGLLLIGCGATGSPTPTTQSAPATVMPSQASTPSIDPTARLRAALDGLEESYAFESTVSVGPEVAVRAAGRWIAGTSEIEVESNGTRTAYRTVPPRAWVQKGENGGWAVLEGEVPGLPPLDALRLPITTELIGETDGVIDMSAMFDATELGQAVDDPIPVALVLGTDGSIEATYSVEVGGTDAVTHTTVRPLPTGQRIEPPPD